MAVTRLAKADVDGDIVDYQGRKLATRDRITHTGTQLAATISDLPEAVQDLVAAVFGGTHTGITFTYDDATGRITAVAAGGGGGAGLDAEALMDFLAGVTTAGKGLVQGTNITLVYDDVNDKITISTTATPNSTDAQLRDRALHTNTQLAATISDFQAKVNQYANPYVDTSIAGFYTSHPYPQRQWDSGTSSWSARPAVPANVRVWSDSTLDVAAVPPPGGLRYDKWIPHPDSPYWPVQ
jgi:hypothetical protein